ncbi:hypothetical protein DOTSEDRAFT_144838 [Dothistroma septosporum NZE10]|uniref:Superoxide dismutase copper/zinc binding domain-containing protein n=1 Tax=Dothistroma septosporum (strain NZE10 / CBS 128990) TaxID=675120 RepID=N1Q561_DOTSN|nr:hypothetical protein DOTSEDRAFT_144838 [Dothistroma septosporum NZE10]
MHASNITFGLVAILPLAFAGAAPKVTNEPAGTQYVATLPNTKSTTGTVMIGSGPGGNGASIQVSISGLPTEGGPFLYHIHEKSVDSTGNCSTAGGHLDPYGNGGTGCNTSDQASCEVGDLSGKHGKMQAPSFSANYIDDYISVKPSADDMASVMGRSIVVHFANKTAITCANLTLNGAATGSNGDVPVQSTVVMVVTALAGTTIGSSTVTQILTTTAAAPSTITNASSITTINPVATTTTVPAAGAHATVGIAAALAGMAAMVL